MRDMHRWHFTCGAPRRRSAAEVQPADDLRRDLDQHCRRYWVGRGFGLAPRRTAVQADTSLAGGGRDQSLSSRPGGAGGVFQAQLPGEWAFSYCCAGRGYCSTPAYLRSKCENVSWWCVGPQLKILFPSVACDRLKIL